MVAPVGADSQHADVLMPHGQRHPEDFSDGVVGFGDADVGCAPVGGDDVPSCYAKVARSIYTPTGRWSRRMRGRGADVDSATWTECIVARAHAGVPGSCSDAQQDARDAGAEWECPIAQGHEKCVRAFLEIGARPDQVTIRP